MEEQTAIQRIASQLLGRQDGIITWETRDHAAKVRTAISGIRMGQKRLNVGNTLASWAAGRSIPTAETIHQFRHQYPSPLWDDLLAALPSEAAQRRQRIERRRQTMIARYGPDWTRIVIPGRPRGSGASVPR